MGHLAHTIRASAVTRVCTVRRMRSETRSALARHRAMREASRYSVKRALQENRAAVIASLRAPELPAIETVSRVAAPGASAPIEHRSVWNFVATTAPAQPLEPAIDPLVPQVLRVIQAHPDGIRAIDVGNALGIDWRRIPAVARELLENGAIEQVAHEYYPTGKASGVW